MPVNHLRAKIKNAQEQGCCKCLFFHGVSGEGVDPAIHMGECRVNPPVKPYSGWRGSWLQVDPDDWCSHWMATKEELPPIGPKGENF